MRATRNRVYGQPYQGFESLLLRQNRNRPNGWLEIFYIIPVLSWKRLTNKFMTLLRVFRPAALQHLGKSHAWLGGNGWPALWDTHQTTRHHGICRGIALFLKTAVCAAPVFFEQQYKALRAEGVKFTKEKTVIMEQFQWDPERDAVPMDVRDLPLVF